MKSEYRADIDGLRAIAVLAVMAYHANPTAVRGGFVGVDIFFVISGYLISRIIFSEIDAGTFSILEFYKRRIRRIFPALILVLIFSLAAGWFLLLLDGYYSLGKHVLASALFLQNITLWLETSYFDREAALKPLLHLWSLGIEEQFYLIWPLAVLAMWTRRASVLFVTIAITLVSFAFNVVSIRYDASTAFYLLPARAWELSAGSLLAYLEFSRSKVGSSPSGAIHPNPSIIIKNFLSWSGAILILISVFQLRADQSFPGWFALAPVAGAAFMIFAGSNAYLNRTILSSRFLVFVGLISYPLYLWHWPLLSFLKIAEGYPSRAAQLAAVLAAFPLAWLTYKFVEKPIRFGGRETTRWRQYPALLAATMAVLGLIGAFAFTSGGMPSRFPAELARILKEPYNVENAYRYRRCFLDLTTQDSDGFKNECLEISNGKTNVLLWGDSHAAHLYPGLRHLQKTEAFNLSQLNACSPIIDTHARVRGEDKCSRITRHVRDIISRQKPDIVVLGARWSNHVIPLSEGLGETISFLKSAGVKKIVIIGPPPLWTPDLKGALAHHFFRFGNIPARMQQGLNELPSVMKTEATLRAIALQHGVDYISALGVLCTSAGCIARIDESQDGLISYDRDHYTEKASIYFIDLIAPALSSIFRGVRMAN